MRLFLVCISTVLLFAGCASREENTTTSSAANRVEWLGNHCVMVTTPIGTKILINPYPAGTGGRTLSKNLNPDVLLITREEPDCTNIEVTDGNPNVYRGSVGIGPNNAGGVRILGTPIYPNASGNAMNAIGMNLVFSWRSGGTKFCYLGPISRALTDAEAQQIGKVDVLILPIDGTGMSNAERHRVVSLLQPKLIVPIKFSAGSVSSFASAYRDGYRLPNRSFRVNGEMLRNQNNPRVLIFGN